MQTAPIEAVIDQWLRKGDVDTAAGQSGVLFKDLKSDLRIIASDIERRSAVVFGRDETPDVPVAQAVAASIAIPLFFRPVKLQMGSTIRTLVDGGIVANFPAWVFNLSTIMSIPIFEPGDGASSYTFKSNPLISIINFDSDSVSVVEFESSKAAGE